jgi:hypothetical protein
MAGWTVDNRQHHFVIATDGLLEEPRYVESNLEEDQLTEFQHLVVTKMSLES